MKGLYTSPRPLRRSLFLERNFFYLYEGPKDLQVSKQALPRRAFILKLTVLMLVRGSPHLVARNPQNPGVPKTGSPKRSVYSEIDDFGTFVPLIWRPEILKIQGSPKQALPKGAFTLKLTILMLLGGSPHLAARNPQNPGVPKTGSPKKSVYSEIDDFDVFAWFPPFGGQKSSKSWSYKDVDDIHMPGPQFLSNT